MVSLKGEVLEVLFYNDENGYTVGVIFDEDMDEPVTFVGNLPRLNIGEDIQIGGEWTVHKTYGRQLKVEHFESIMPTTTTGIERYLSSGLIKGIGPSMARRIVTKFGTETMDIIQNKPELLMEVNGIGKKTLDRILKSYYQNIGLRNIIIELGQFGMTVNQCIKIYKKFKERSIEVLRQNPYEIADKVSGIGFKAMDKVAISMGYPGDSPDRITQAILYVLKLASSSGGHSFLPEKILISETAKLIRIDEDKVIPEISAMAFEGKVQIEKVGMENIVYLYQFYKAESYVCKKIIEIATDETLEKMDEDEFDERIEKFEEAGGIKLANHQRIAVWEAINSKFLVLTGGPGTGKTTTVNAIINIFEQMQLSVLLAAPTGRAAKRMTETTSREAKTIHRLLEMNFDDSDSAIFLKNEEDPILADVIIIDEASMIDISLMCNFLKAISPDTKLILVGDSDQLPSVGAGNVLKDIINSGIVNVVMLSEIFRQSKESYIIRNAHHINHGERLEINNKDSDFFFIPRDNPDVITDEIIGLISTRLPDFLGIDKLKDIQILSPMRRGELGVTSLNLKLQDALNPKNNHKVEEKFSNRILRVGDKVMQVRNNYEKSLEDEFGEEISKGVYNGDIGYIHHIDKPNKEVFVIYDDEKIAVYDYDELDEIEHCFATTIHKSQGSEFPVVIIPITWGPPMLLNRNLIYTAVTRAKRMVVLVGEFRYLEQMIRNTNVNTRFSYLDNRLKKLGEFIEDQS